MSLTGVMEALADQIETNLTAVENLQVTATLNLDPTPPSIDIYPSETFMEGLTFGKGNVSYRLAVRARVSTAAHEEGQQLLLAMMDPLGASSMHQAILDDRTLGSACSSVTVEGPTAFGIYTDAGGVGSLLGAVWTVLVLP